MNTYRYEVVATYSTIITVEAETVEDAEDKALESAPNWISVGSEMAYTEDVKVYMTGDK